MIKLIILERLKNNNRTNILSRITFTKFSNAVNDIKN